MGGKSSSSNSSQTTNYTDNYNLQGLYGGTAVMGDQKNYTSVVDGGAFEFGGDAAAALSDTAQAALRANVDTSAEAFEVSKRAIESGNYYADTLAEQNRQSLVVLSDTVGDAMQRTADQSKSALEFVSSATKADGGQSETIVKYSLIAAVLIVASSRFKK